MTGIDENFMDEVDALAKRCATRMDADANTLVRSAIDAGEWGEALTETGSGLYQASATITGAERDTLRRLFVTAGLDTKPVDTLVVSG